jgi:hypothetical protein
MNRWEENYCDMLYCLASAELRLLIGDCYYFLCERSLAIVRIILVCDRGIFEKGLVIYLVALVFSQLSNVEFMYGAIECETLYDFLCKYFGATLN